MDELIKLFTNAGGPASMVSIYHVVTAMLLSFGLTLLVCYIYKTTHSGISYSQSLIKTLVMMSVIVAVIMIIIGSNIARAFSLVGALSIIRFRSAVKDPLDVAYVFLAMAIGMACGTGFYAIAVLLAVVMSSMIYFMYRFDIGAVGSSEMVLKITVGVGVDEEDGIRAVFYEFLNSFDLLSTEMQANGEHAELVYSVELKCKKTTSALAAQLQRQVSGIGKVQILTGMSNMNI
jgi:uncharacterized membrane protein YhiD involved in acid resistance